MSRRKPRVLFLCTGNSCRSQMAEALLRARTGARLDAYSAGLHPRPIHPVTRRVMSEIGLDLAAQHSKGFGEVANLRRITFVITVCATVEAECPRQFAPAAVRLSWPFEDPAAVEGSKAHRLAAFRRVRDAIDERIRTWLKEDLPPGWLSGRSADE